MKIKAYYNGNITITSGYVLPKSLRNKITRSDRTKKKLHKLSYSKYRQLSGNSARMFQKKKNQVLFLTFTIKDNISDNSITNKAWSYFLRLMRTRHGLNSYLWVAERQKRGAVHYHALMDLPYIDFEEINRIYSRSFGKFGISTGVNNSVSVGRFGAVVKNVEMAVKYITKYISKQINVIQKGYFEGRVYSFSNNINTKPIEITYEEFLEVRNTTKKVYNFEYCGTYICDLAAVISLFKRKIDHIWQVKVENHGIIPINPEIMPTFMPEFNFITYN